MTSKTHNLFATASLLTVGYLFPPETYNIVSIIIAFVSCSIGALIPDLDQSTNRLWDLFPGQDFFGKLFRPLFLGHRSLSHSLLGTFILYKICINFIPIIFNKDWLNPQIIIISLMIGFISHLIADGLTEEGIPLLFPINYKFGFPPIKSWRIMTGKWFENLVIFPLLVAYTVYFLIYIIIN